MALILSSSAHAQAVHDPQIWTAVASTAALGDAQSGPALWLDAHLRRSGSGTLSILRPAVGWQQRKWMSAWVGYAWIPTLPDEAAPTNEHRVWQQVILQRGFEAWTFQSRTRFEQRLVAGGDVGLRLREFVRAGWSWDDEARHGLVWWDELFLGLNQTDWGAPAGFDQNRLFAGFYARSGKALRVEIGYLSLYLNRDPDSVGHVLATNLFVTL